MPIANPSASLRFVLILLATLACVGCFIPKADSPMEMHFYDEPTENPELLVMLPGIFDPIERFDSFREIGERYPSVFDDASWVAVNAHMGYYKDAAILGQFEEDILTPYAPWPKRLVGVSLGGFGACILASEWPERYEELILVAPFLGKSRFLQQRVRPGFLEMFPEDSPRERALTRVWRFLQDEERQVKVTILIGEDDRLIEGARLAEELAPNLTLRTGPGGHGWETWVELWDAYLAERCKVEGG